MSRIEADIYDRIISYLWLGWTQEEIADKVGVALGSISNYNQELKDREGERYIKIRHRNKRLRKKGISFDEVEETLDAVIRLMEHEELVEEFSVWEVSRMLGVVAQSIEHYEKHDVVRRLTDLITILEELDLELAQMLEDPDLLSNRLNKEIPPPRRRTMSEAVQWKGRHLSDLQSDL